MFCKEGNVPISVFHELFMDAFSDHFDSKRLTGSEYFEYEKAVDKYKYKLQLGMDAELRFLHGCETFTATSEDGVSLRIDPKIFLKETASIFLNREYEQLGALGALGAIKDNVFCFLFVHHSLFFVSVSLWDEVFQRRVKRIKTELFKLQNKDNDFFDEIEIIAKKIQSFEGWSLSISNEEATSALGSILEHYPFKEVFEGRGRKSLVKAREYWQYEMEFDKGDKSWGQVANLIKNKTKEKPSPKSLRDWRESPLPPRD